ncbi:MAG: hypothetical protein K2N48_00100 [Muribaculaceae bacterium]|nr:hypothetical protein [Muribaculaceae bacterium]
MKLDNAVRIFTEKYDAEAMGSIDQLSNEFGLVANRHTMPAIALQEAFDKFGAYLEGYGQYKIRCMNDPKASSQEHIKEATEKFMGTLLGKTDLPYAEVANFVKSYAEGVQKMIPRVEAVKSAMMEANVDAECIGDVNTFADQFMEKVDAAFYPVMESILLASGYTTHKALSREAQMARGPAPVFL